MSDLAFSIGPLIVKDPVGLYGSHLTHATFGDYFQADWAPAKPPVTPASLWRANHLDAGWQINQVRAFMAQASQAADELLASAPLEVPFGAPERLSWAARLIQECAVAGVRAARLTKALHPFAPDSIPLIDGKIVPYALENWLGTRLTGGGWSSSRTLAAWEALEICAGELSDQLATVVEGVRVDLSDRHPVSVFGLLDAVFWQSYKLSKPGDSNAYVEWSEAAA